MVERTGRSFGSNFLWWLFTYSRWALANVNASLMFVLMRNIEGWMISWSGISLTRYHPPYLTEDVVQTRRWHRCYFLWFAVSVKSQCKNEQIPFCTNPVNEWLELHRELKIEADKLNATALSDLPNVTVLKTALCKKVSRWYTFINLNCFKTPLALTLFDRSFKGKSSWRGHFMGWEIFVHSAISNRLCRMSKT